MRLTELLRRCSIATRVADGGAVPADPLITNLTFDSRTVGPGTLFVALEGARNDGHDYVRAAVAAGASAVLVSEQRATEFADLTVPVVQVDGPRRRLGSIAAEFFDRPSDTLSIVGITGTNGKTTISYMLEAVLQHAGRAPGVIGTVNYRWPGHVEPAPNTTPESLVVQRLLARMRDDGVEAVAMEVSSHGLATHRVQGTSFDVGVFTNLSQDHLDFHESMEDYRDAKRTLFLDYLADDGAAVLNIDDDEGRALARMLGPRSVTTSGSGADATWTCTSWNQRIEGTTMHVDSPSGPLQIETQLLGRFNASNVLQTLAAAAALGVDPHDAATAFRDLRGVPGRLQHIGGAGQPQVFVDYAHTPDALERALGALRPLTRGRLVAVFGCGGDRDRDKRPLMGAVATAGADAVFVTSDNPRSEDPAVIIAEIEGGLEGDGWRSIADRAEAIRVAIAEAAADDVILIAGKGHETYQEVRGVRRPFDDLEHARSALESRS